MITNHSIESCSDGYTRSSFGVVGRSGRLYLTTGTFGIDVNVSSVRAEVEQCFSNFSKPIGRHLIFARGERISINCEVERGFSVVTQTKSNSKEIFWELDSRCLLVSSDDRPAPPRPAVWLPGGVWNCERCSSAQLPDLFQCRHCGAPRFGVDQ